MRDSEKGMWEADPFGIGVCSVFLYLDGVACLSSINLATFSVDAVYASDIKA
jgi:hypothetical protein